MIILIIIIPQARQCCVQVYLLRLMVMSMLTGDLLVEWPPTRATVDLHSSLQHQGLGHAKGMEGGVELIQHAEVELASYQSYSLHTRLMILENRANCGDPGTPVNGRRVLGTTFQGDIVRYFCSQGFQLEGDQQRVCQRNGQWSGRLPICRRVSKTHVTISINIMHLSS